MIILELIGFHVMLKIMIHFILIALLLSIFQKRPTSKWLNNVCILFLLIYWSYFKVYNLKDFFSLLLSKNFKEYDEIIILKTIKQYFFF